MSAPLCGRVGCDSTASSVLLIAPQECEAWLVGLDHQAADEGVKLCEAHADRITVPFGWGLHNERPAPKRRRRRAPKKAASAAADEPPPAKAAATKKAQPKKKAAPKKARTGTTAAEPRDERVPPDAPAAETPTTEEPAVPATDDSTVQLPVVEVDEPTETPAPADVPVRADHVAEVIVEADDPRHLQVVAPGQDAPADKESIDEQQPSFWDDDEADDQLVPTDRTPMLKRAFRVVRDD